MGYVNMTYKVAEPESRLPRLLSLPRSRPNAYGKGSVAGLAPAPAAAMQSGSAFHLAVRRLITV